jgi:cell division initiation protein
VTITPADIEAQQFPIVFRGYKVEAVDAFLDRLQQDLAGTSGEQAAPATSTSTTPADGAADRPAPGADVDADATTDAERPVDGETGHAARALRTLVHAEQMAEQMTADAAAEADDIRARAQAEAEAIIAAARAESGRLDAELNTRRQHEVGGLLVQAQQLRAEIDRLNGLERQYHDALQALLSEQQRLLEQRIPVLDAAAAAAGKSAADDLRPAA